MKTESIRIGISGWRYRPWRGSFYPQTLAQRNELQFASQAVTSIEMNGSFYSLQRPSSFSSWYEATPESFVFSVKGPRFITHIKKLNDVETPLANFFASGVLLLKEKLGPILWQFPESVIFHPEKFETFLQLLPRTYDQARNLARKHDYRLKSKAAVPPMRKQKLRYAFEIRHPSFACKEFVKLLRKYDAALVVADTAGRWPKLYDVTSDFVYIRLHGEAELYASGYDGKSLRRWATLIKEWSNGSSSHAPSLLATPAKKLAQRSVFVYFDNDVKVFAPFNAHALGVLLKSASPEWQKLQLGDEPLKLPPKNKRLGPRAAGRMGVSKDSRWEFTQKKRASRKKKNS